MSGAELVWGVMGAGVIAYVLTGGADFGGGLWHLLASGERRTAQRRAIERALAPIWEANHVWLIFVVVLLFTVFPRAFATVGIALHIPVTLALIGIVLRGSAFSFHSYGTGPAVAQGRWALAFGVSSVLSPLFLGATLAALSTGDIRWVNGLVTSGFFAGWTTPFAWLTGLFAVALFALLAAVYLTVDSPEEVRDDFRVRALVLEVAAGALAGAVFWRSSVDAPQLFHRLAHSSWTLPLQAATAAAALATLSALYQRRYRLARITVALQVTLVVVGWGFAMDGHVVMPDLTVHNSGAEATVIAALLPALAVGGALIAPALYYLFRVFKRGV